MQRNPPADANADTNAAQLLKAADIALYRAKASGRNRVELQPAGEAPNQGQSQLPAQAASSWR